MMKKRISIFVMTFLLFLATGCEEVENQDGMGAAGDSKTPLVEAIDLSAVSAPKEAAVYSAEFFDREPEEIARIFLGSDFEEGETAAEGRIFVCDAGTPNEKTVCAYDSGRACFGDNRHIGNNGVNFGSHHRNIDTNNTEYDTIRREYSNEGKISGGEDSGKDGEFLGRQKRIAKYLERLGVDGYELYSAGTFHAGQENGCLMYFKLTVDGIPVTHILFENNDKKSTYNHRHSIVSDDFGCLNADVEACFLGDELVSFGCQSLVNVGRALKKYPLLPVDDAYEKVKERYPAASGEEGDYVLEYAQLQYMLGMPDLPMEDMYLYPVWIFGVHNKKEAMVEFEWTYYIVDAVTGELFSDIPEEYLQ